MLKLPEINDKKGENLERIRDMQYLRSKTFDLYLVILTLAMGMATPALMIWNNQRAIRAYSISWARAVSWGIWFIIGLRYRIDGVIPNDGKPRLIISNHQSMWETIIFACRIPAVSFVAKRELTKVPIFGWYMKKFPMVLINRGAGRSALNDLLEKAEQAIAQGQSILIFPEGTRIPPDENKSFQYGVAALYGRLGIPAVTIAHNSGCFWNDEYAMKYSGDITVRVIEEIQPGLSNADFLRRVETSINSVKSELRDELDVDEWRWAVG